MGTIKVVLSEDLEARFRRHLAATRGLRKGVISEAVQEAIEQWIQSPAKLKDPAIFRSKHPGKYLAISENKVLASTDTLEELFTEIANIDTKVFIVHPETQQRKVKLGWRSQVN